MEEDYENEESIFSWYTFYCGFRYSVFLLLRASTECYNALTILVFEGRVKSERIARLFLFFWRMNIVHCTRLTDMV